MTQNSFLIMLIAACSILACTDDSFNHFGGDYFPLGDKQTWSYQRSTNTSFSPVYVWDTLTLITQGDTVSDGDTYKMLADACGYTNRIVRAEGSKYYIRTHNVYRPNAAGILAVGYSEEYLFLDSGKPVGYSWTVNNDGFTPKAEYHIKARLTDMTVNNSVYHDVIEVEVTYYTYEGDDLKPWRAGISFYAKDLGEIYRFEPSPFTSTYIDFTYNLMEK